MASQFSTNALSAYSNEQSKELFTKMLFGFETLDSDTIRVIDTVKETIKLKYQNSTIAFQAGGCAFNASGAVTLSDKTFGVTKLKHDTELCEEDLDGTSFEIFLNPGSNNGMEMELLNNITNEISLQVQTTLENDYWNSVTGATKIYGGGIFTQVALDANATARTFNWTHSAQTHATIIAEVIAIFNALPAVVQKNAVLYCGYDVYNRISQALIFGMNYNLNADVNNYFPGTTMKLVKSSWITNRVLATVSKNLTYVTDTKDEPKQSRVQYNPFTYMMQVHIPFRAGAGYFFGEYIVYTKPA